MPAFFSPKIRRRFKLHIAHTRSQRQPTGSYSPKIHILTLVSVTVHGWMGTSCLRHPGSGHSKDLSLCRIFWMFLSPVWGKIRTKLRSWVWLYWRSVGGPYQYSNDCCGTAAARREGVQFMSCLLPFCRCTKISARQKLSTRRRLAGDASSSCAPHEDATRESLECECPAWIGCKTSEKQTTRRKSKVVSVIWCRNRFDWQPSLCVAGPLLDKVRKHPECHTSLKSRCADACRDFWLYWRVEPCWWIMFADNAGKTRAYIYRIPLRRSVACSWV